MIKIDNVNGECGVYGTVPRDAEFKAFGNKKVVAFTIASHRGKSDKQRTSWVNCVVWEEQLHEAASKIRKSDRLVVKGP